MKTFRILAPAGLLMLGACAGQAPRLEAYDQGKHHLARNEVGLALQSFRHAIHQEGRSVRVLNAIGAAYDAMGRPEAADMYYREALTLDPNDVQTMNNLGYSLLIRGKVQDAESLLTLAAERAPQDTLIAGNLHMVRARLAESPSPAQTPTPATAEPSAKPVPQLPLPPPSGPPVRLGPWIERSARAVFTLRTDLVAYHRAVEQDATPELALPPAAIAQTHVSARTCTVEIANGNGRDGAAARLRNRLRPAGVIDAALTNAESFTVQRTTVTYAPGCGDHAARLAMALPVAARVVPATDGARVGLRVVIGRDLLPFDRKTEVEI